MDVRDLSTFLVCARHENFTRAAAELNYVQSTVTAQIKGLERELGVPLFDRVGRGVSLTVAGDRLAGYAEQVVALVEEAALAVTFEGARPHGDLTISATETLSTFHLPAVLREFQQRFPDVRLFLRPQHPTALVEGVVSGKVAAAVVLDALIAHEDVQIRVLREEPVVVLAPPGHVLARQSRVSAADLEPFRLLLSEFDVSYGGAFLRHLASEGVTPVRPMEFFSVAAIKQCVQVGMGLTVLPRFACQTELDAGQLVVLAHPCPPVHVQLLSHRSRWVPPAARALLDLCAEMLAPDGEEVVHS